VRGYDSDQDGLPDEWEAAGSVNGVALSGAQVGTKDVYLWIDHMYKACSNWSCKGKVDYKLNRQLEPIYAAFARQNINLYVKHGTLDHQVTYVEDIPLGEKGIDCATDTAKELMRCGLASFKEQGFWKVDGQEGFNKSREKIYHYMLIGDSFDGGTISGIVFREPNIIFVARGQINDDTALSGTIMHEFGHALGLNHGGPINGDYGSDAIVTTENGTEIENYNIHYKPNYLSVMNYHFQKSGLRTINANGEIEYGKIDYAVSSLSTIDENDLSTTISCLTPDIACITENFIDNYASKFIRNPDSSGTLPELCAQYGWGRCPANIDDLSVIDWKNDGAISAEVNWKKAGDNAYEKAAYGEGKTRLVSQADWPNLDFSLSHIGDPDEAIALTAGIDGSEEIVIIEPPVEEITFPMDYRLELSAVRQLAIFKPGASRSALGYRLANTGNQADDYTISYQVEINDGSGVPANAWQVSGSTSVHLAPNTETYLDIVVTAPSDVVDGNEAEIVITVASAGNANIKGQQFGIIRITEAVFTDSDGDGIPDEVELEQGTDPNNADADGDGLIDSQDPEPNTPNPVESAPVEPSWLDISDLVTVNKTAGAYNRVLRKISSILTITNNSGESYDGTIRVELVSANIALSMDADGQLENGNYYWDITSGSGSFSENDELSMQLNFSRVRARLSYEVKIYAKPK